jgi:AAA domain-containing protein
MPEPRRYLTRPQQQDVLRALDDLDAEKQSKDAKTRSNGHRTPIEAAPDVLRLYTPTELLDFPEPSWLVEPFIVDGTLSILYGASGTFKSFIALSWAAQAPGLAIYISAEGSPKRLGERIHALEHDLGLPSNILTIPHPVNLIHDAEVFTATLDAIPTPPRLLIVDTAARNMAGHDENSTKDMGTLIASLDEIRYRYQLSVLVIHHSGHENTDRERGSSALRGAADISIHAKRGDTPLTVKLRCAKARDTAEFEPCLITLTPIQDTLVAGQPITPQTELEDRVRTYLQNNPNATQNEVEAHVPGRAANIRRAFHKVKYSGTHPNPHG